MTPPVTQSISNTPRAVGIIGLGAMGMGVARTLVRKGFQVHAFDIRADALASLAAEGATPHPSPAGVAARVDALVVLVLNADQLDQVLFGPDGAAAHLKPGTVVIASPTVAPQYAEALGERLAALGLRHLDAPVSGGAARAGADE